ncbi:MAG: hypothetical protein NVS4B8_03530 [Herpetosiphon sp.]
MGIHGLLQRPGNRRPAVPSLLRNLALTLASLRQYVSRAPLHLSYHPFPEVTRLGLILLHRWHDLHLRRIVAYFLNGYYTEREE